MSLKACRKAVGILGAHPGGSAQPCLTHDASDLVSDQPLDDAGEMFVEPSL
jgi:hypothetical protein